TPAVDLVAVRALIEPVAVAHGLQIHDVVWTSSRGGNILRVTLEQPLGDVSEPDGPHALGGGVTIDDCARVSRDLSTVLDAEDSIDPRYTLEVSSPGADRQLVGEEDFRRHLGRNVKVKLTEPAADGQRVLRGAIRSVGDGVVGMEVDGNHHDVALDNVAQARLVFELGAQPKGGAGRPGARRRNRSKGRSGKPATGSRPSAREPSAQGQRDDDPGV
ncbi:MAG: ribosome maturation factor RimP, partial [Deltaproteobacteria bacterium]|nr:ribosome maturation factor RimP [Deltaproteobacteria bacterium]